MMIVVSFFTKSLSIFALMPAPVIGGLILGMIGTILSIGVASLRHVDMSKNRFVYCISWYGIAILGWCVNTLMQELSNWGTQR